MSQPIDFLEYIRYYDGAVWQYYIYNGTAVSTSTTKTPLKRSPEGWQEYITSLERGFELYGIDTIYTTPLKFLKDGAYIIRHLYYTYGIMAKAELFIEKLNRATYEYEDYFSGDLNFVKLQDEHDYCILPILEGGTVDKLKSRYDTVYEFELESNSNVEWLKHDGITLQSKISFSVPLGDSYDGLDFSETIHDIPKFVWLNTEGVNLYTKFWNVDTANAWTDLFGNDSPDTIDYNLKGVGTMIIDPNGSYTGAAYVKIVAIINDSAGTFVSDYTLWTSPIPLPLTTQAFNFTVDDNISLLSSYRCTIGVKVDGFAVTAWNTTQFYMNLDVSFANRYDPTYIPVLSISTLASALLRRIADDNTLILTSDLLVDTLNDEHYFSSGDGVRGLPNSKIRISLRELFEFVNTKFGASMYFDKVANSVFIEAKEFVFDNTVNPNYTTPFEITKFQCVPFTSEVGTNLKIGSQTYNETDSLTDEDVINNAKYEANVTNDYLTPLTKLDNKGIVMLPSVRDDIYGIENVRINLTGKSLADSENDNDVFAFHIDTSSFASYTVPETGNVIDYYELYRKPINLTPGASYWEIENVYSPETVYNIKYSPARCMYANGNYLRALYKKNDSDSMIFQAKGKNTAAAVGMITSEGATPLVINEISNILISSLCANDKVLFLPYMFHITTKNKIDLYALLYEYRFKTIPFIHKGETFYGFIVKASSKPRIGATSELVLLSSPSNDLTKLITTDGV